LLIALILYEIMAKLRIRTVKETTLADMYYAIAREKSFDLDAIESGPPSAPPG
jgi:hypothetical protein